jgi:transcriptional regulator with XRE-family HTH domain
MPPLKHSPGEVAYNNALAERLRYERENRELGRGEVAHHLRMETRHYRDFETGHRLLTCFAAEKLCDLYGITMDDLLSEANEAYEFGNAV